MTTSNYSNLTINSGVAPKLGALLMATMSTSAFYALGVCISTTNILTFVRGSSSGFSVVLGIGSNQIYGRFVSPTTSALYTCNLKIIY